MSSLLGGLAPNSQGVYFHKDMEIDLHDISDASPLYPTGTEAHHTPGISLGNGLIIRILRWVRAQTLPVVPNQAS